MYRVAVAPARTEVQESPHVPERSVEFLLTQQTTVSTTNEPSVHIIPILGAVDPERAR